MIHITKIAGTTNKNIHGFKQVLASISAAIGILSIGLAFGFSGLTLSDLLEDDSISYDEKYDSWVASIMPLSASFGCLFTCMILDSMGRKKLLIALTLPVIVGWLCMAFAKDIVLLLIGRFLTGMCTGAYRPCTSVFIGEITDPKYRSSALFSISLMLHVGVLLSHIVGNYVYWRLACLLCILPNLISLVMLLFLRESPLWMILKGLKSEGIENFEWYRGKGNASQKDLKDVLDKQKGGDLTLDEIISIVFSRSFMKPFITVILLLTAAQFIGISTINFYAEDIVDNTFSNQVNTFVLVMVIDITRVVASTILSCFIKFLTPKSTFLFFSFGASVCSLVLMLTLLLKSTLIWLTVITMVLYIASGSLILSLSWTFLPEIFPGKIRGLGCGVSASISFILLYISVQINPYLLFTLGVEFVYCVFGGTTLFCSVFLCFLLSETKGKTLQEIEDSYINQNINSSVTHI